MPLLDATSEVQVRTGGLENGELENLNPGLSPAGTGFLHLRGLGGLCSMPYKKKKRPR